MHIFRIGVLSAGLPFLSFTKEMEKTGIKKPLGFKRLIKAQIFRIT
jgi:hypothetical protein